MKSRIKIIIKVIALIAVIVAAYFFVSKHAADFVILKIISLRLIFLLALIYAVEIILNSVLFSLLINSFSKPRTKKISGEVKDVINRRNQQSNIVDKQYLFVRGEKIKPFECFFLTCVHRLANYLISQGGALTRAYYLKKKKGFSYTDYLAFFFFITLVQVAATSFLSLTMMFFVSINSAIFSWSLVLLFAVMAVFGWGFLFLPITKIKNLITRPKKLKELLVSWQGTEKNVKTKVFAILLMFGILTTYSLRLFLLYNFFNISISIPAILLIVSLAILSFFISITPAALGIREGVMIAAAYLSGYSYIDTAIVATADRALVFCVILILNIFIGIYFLLRKFSPYYFTIRYLNKYNKYIPTFIKRGLTRLWLSQVYFRPRLSACKDPIFILGNQKSGTTVVASLLARATNRSLAVDLRQEILKPSFTELKSKQLFFDKFINKNILDFSKKIIKVPELSFFYNELRQHYKEAKYIFIIRDPRDNIRSLLNRLNIPGDLERLEERQIKKLPLAWQLVFRTDWLGKENSRNYIKNLSTRWSVAADTYLKNKDKIILVKFEDFLRDKAGTIGQLAAKCGLEKINDIEKLVDKQFQPQGNKKTTWQDFYSETNLKIIEKICGQAMKEFGY